MSGSPAVHDPARMALPIFAANARHHWHSFSTLVASVGSFFETVFIVALPMIEIDIAVAVAHL